ncbi:DUF6777 domain-containing protein [Streptomyces sp. NPDC001744]|uniref:DUF6777 domain-containing protein n=1 Tax=Streptomyces sp. NPDC001744 TaxID=3364606 RepID=UPI003685C133
MPPPLRRTRRTVTAPREGARLAAAALASALLLTGCSSGETGAGGAARAAAAPAQDVLLQASATPGPDPFTASTVRNTVRPSAPAGDRDAGGTGGTREVTGSTPGLYGGTRAIGSCDVERQIALLAGDGKKTKAFAGAVGVPGAGVADWLRGLTPVALREDVRVTGHGYRDGRAHAFQSVLQNGTAVLVDRYGAPRVRCACGNPLGAPAADRGGVHRGDPWDGFDPDRVITVRPAPAPVPGLVIVNATDRTWIERRTGSDGAEDRRPDVEPACDPDACVRPGPATPDPSAPGRTPPDSAPTPPDPSDPGTPDPGTPSESAPDPDPSVPGDASPAPDPDAYPEPPAEPFPDPFADPSAPPDGELPPGEVLPPGPVPDQPETFEG